MDAYSAAGWESWSVAEAGASAALSGLVFVAVSINLARILAYSGLPRRAAETIAILVNVLIASTLTLVPGQSTALLGAELLVAGLTVWSRAWCSRLWPVWSTPGSCWWRSCAEGRDWTVRAGIVDHSGVMSSAGVRFTGDRMPVLVARVPT